MPNDLTLPEAKHQKALRVTKSNTLITAAYRLTLNEQRLILAAISQLDPRRPMPKKVSVSASDFSEIYGIPLRHAYEQMREAADVLYDRDIKTFDDKGVERKRWVDRARYVEGEGRVELSFTIHVMPYLTMLYSKVTTYDLRRVASLDSTYSFRLFEMLMQFRKTGWAYFEIETIRVALGLSDAYQRFNNLRQRVIDPAVAELRSKSGLDVSYELKKEGRKVTAIKFRFADLAQLQLGLEPEEDFASLAELEEAGEEWLMTQPLEDLIELTKAHPEAGNQAPAAEDA